MKEGRLIEKMSKEKKPHVTLVGAGPGDPELITLKAIAAIRAADVILYDALVNESLLDYAEEHCVKIYVGKRAERLSISQDEINRLLVDYAFNYGHVVRLKGGDPFVFGRGGEEIDYARKHNISTTVIPGISSSVGLAALQQIPLTYRGISESFWVITGSTSTGQFSDDLLKAAETNATVVVLMGFSKLRDIVDLYKGNGREHLPIAVIQNGSLPEERIVVSTIANVMEDVSKSGVGVPAVIVIGEVVAKHLDFRMITAQVEYISK